MPRWPIFHMNCAHWKIGIVLFGIWKEDLQRQANILDERSIAQLALLERISVAREDPESVSSQCVRLEDQ